MGKKIPYCHQWSYFRGMGPFSFSDEFSIEFSPFLVIFLGNEKIGEWLSDEIITKIGDNIF